jgi:gamma-glutamylcyclotransferase (GGCT)/AIG2-like uncharacterized protein YtfP
MHVFTYGSLMYRQVWEHVVTGTYPSCSGVIHGYVRRRIVGETYPALVRATPTDPVAGVVYLNISVTDLAALDAFEDEGTAYVRMEVPVTLGNGSSLSAWTYLYRHLDKVEPTAWDPKQFEGAGLDRFLATYCHDHASRVANDEQRLDV